MTGPAVANSAPLPAQIPQINEMQTQEAVAEGQNMSEHINVNINGHDQPPPDLEGNDALAAVPEPNLADIKAHLYEIFSPVFVHPHTDAWIEIAAGDPRAGEGNTGPREARHFSVFDLEKAADCAVRTNKKGHNVYVGMALRKGETGKHSNGRATKDNVVTSSRGWADFDKEGDYERVAEAIRQKGIEHAELTITGTIPHRRFQLMIALAGNPTPEQLEAVNTAMRDCLGGNGDGVQNCDRVMRLAGTVNYPPPYKIKRGYTPELTRLVIKKGARAYDSEELLQLLKEDEPLRPSANGKAPLTGPASSAPRSAPDGEDIHVGSPTSFHCSNHGRCQMARSDDSRPHEGPDAASHASGKARSASVTFGEARKVFEDAGFPANALLPGIPVGGPLGMKSTIDPKRLGKIPGRYDRREEAWYGAKGWPTEGLRGMRSDPERIADWPTRQVSIAGTEMPGFDIDSNDPVFVAAMQDTCQEVTSVQLPGYRGRSMEGVLRRMFPLVPADGPGTISSWSLVFVRGDQVNKVELKGHATQWVGGGDHPDGDQYLWHEGVPDIRDIPRVTSAEVEALRIGVIEKAQALGWELRGPQSRRSSSDRRERHDHEPMMTEEQLEGILDQMPTADRAFNDRPSRSAMVGWFASIRWLMGRTGDHVPGSLIYYIGSYGGVVPADEYVSQIWNSLDDGTAARGTFLKWASEHWPKDADRSLLDSVERAKALHEAAFEDETAEMAGDRAKNRTHTAKKDQISEFETALERLRDAREIPTFRHGGMRPLAVPQGQDDGYLLWFDPAAPDPVSVRPDITSLLARGEVTLLSAAPGAGKSSLTLNIAAAIAYERAGLIGENIVDWAGACVVVSNEDGRGTLGRKMKTLQQQFSLPETSLHALHFRDEHLTIAELEGKRILPTGALIRFINVLADLRREHDIALVVVDTLASAIAGADENDAGAMQAVMSILVRIARAAFAAVLVVHHTGKAAAGDGKTSGYRGSSAILGAVRSAADLVRPSNEDEQLYGWTKEDARSIVKLVGTKANDRPRAETVYFRFEGCDLRAEDPREPSEDRYVRAAALVPFTPVAAAPSDEVMRDFLIEQLRADKLIRRGGLKGPEHPQAATVLLRLQFGLPRSVAAPLIDRIIETGWLKTGEVKVGTNSVAVLQVGDRATAAQDGDEAG